MSTTIHLTVTNRYVLSAPGSDAPGEVLAHLLYEDGDEEWTELHKAERFCVGAAAGKTTGSLPIRR